MEFHAYILCGSGKELNPFSQTRATGTPKALLPVANRPMIEYVLEWCDRAFFPQITIVCSEESQEEISKALAVYNERRQAILTANLVPSDYDGAKAVVPSPISVMATDSGSSGEVLYRIYQQSKASELENELGIASSANASTSTLVSAAVGAVGAAAGDATAGGAIAGSAGSAGSSGANEHFVLLPCDFFTDLPPQVLIDAYRNKSDTDLGLFVKYRNLFEALCDKKVYSKTFHTQNHYTVYSELPDGELRLLDMYSHDDVAFHKALALRSQMSWRYSNATVSTKLLNSTVFFAHKAKVLAAMAQTKKFEDASYFSHRTATKIVRDFARRSWKHSSARDTVGLFIVPEVASFYRCNNLPVYLEANRYFMKQMAGKQEAKRGSGAVSGAVSAVVGADSLVGADTTLGEKTNVKRSIVGRGCTVGKRVKLTGCVVFDLVTIEDDVHLENCIVGHHAVIESKAKLTNCNVESTLEVSKGKQAKGETLLVLTLEGIEAGAAGVSELAIGSDSDDSDEYSSSEYDSEEYEDDGDYDNDDGLFAH